jgi:hypothetical protein
VGLFLCSYWTQKLKFPANKSSNSHRTAGWGGGDLGKERTEKVPSTFHTANIKPGTGNLGIEGGGIKRGESHQKMVHKIIYFMNLRCVKNLLD